MVETMYAYFTSEKDENGGVADTPRIIPLNEEDYIRRTGHKPEANVMRLDLYMPKVYR